MSQSYHYKKGAMVMGPFTLGQMQGFAGKAEIGRSHLISIDGGQSWLPGSEIPEIFATPTPPPPPPPPPPGDEPGPTRGDDDGEDEPSLGPLILSTPSYGHEPAVTPPPRDAGVNVAGISGFICSIVAIVMLMIPCLVWVLIAQSFFWIFNIVIPLAVLALLGLVLSVLGLSRPGRKLATAGVVLGVIAVSMAVMAIAGAATIRYRMAGLRAVQIAAAKTEIELSRKQLAESLSTFRSMRQDAGEDEELFRLRQQRVLEEVGMHLGNLVEHCRDYLSATSMTSEFHNAFQVELPRLRSTVVEVQQAAKLAELSLADVMRGGMANMQLLKTLDDMLGLYQGGKITLAQVEAKMAGQ